MLDCVLFDLDNTLLKMDQVDFTKKYLDCLSSYLAFYGYEPKRLVDTVMKGTARMIKNDGKATNAELFWTVFLAEYGESAYGDRRYFDRFYEEKFDSLSAEVGEIGGAAETLMTLSATGVKLVLASNPVFPEVAMRKRAAWADIDTSVFCKVTAYENSRHCKPNPDYYTEIANELKVLPENCLMIGNDVREDMAAQRAGMDVLLVHDRIINLDGADISAFRSGGIRDACIYALNKIGNRA